MVRERRVEPEVDRLWDDFHSCVNVTSEQLRTWLMTQGCGEDTFTANPDLDLPEPGRSILAVLRKRKVDLTPADIETMRDTVDEIQSLVDARPQGALSDQGWRHALLDLGHDPLIER